MAGENGTENEKQKENETVSRLSQLSLQELCEKKSLNEILDLNFKASEFTMLEPRLQEILFDRLRTEITRLQAIEDKWGQMRHSCPRLDIEVQSTYKRLVNYDEEEDEDDESPYGQRTMHREKWSYATESERYRHHAMEENPVIRWHHLELHYEASESDLGHFVHDPLRRHEYTYSFGSHISSQLLLYRITVTFGMPPPIETDEYKSCWGSTLRHCDGTSELFFEDYKGSASVRFDGTPKANADALELVNFLTGMKCPHTYDGTVAGAIA